MTPLDVCWLGDPRNPCPLMIGVILLGEPFLVVGGDDLLPFEGAC